VIREARGQLQQFRWLNLRRKIRNRCGCFPVSLCPGDRGLRRRGNLTPPTFFGGNYCIRRI
jgi:hypothetical protein